MPGGLIAFLAIAGVALIGYLVWVSEKKRRARLLLFAQENGFQFFPSGDPSGAEPQGCNFFGSGFSQWFTKFDGFHPFEMGHSRTARNLFVKSDDGKVWYFFDYTYVTGSGKHRSTHSYWIGVIEFRANVPGLRIRPESVFDKLGAFVGFRDIEFEFEEFNRKFHVSGSDDKFAYAVVNPKMMEFLMHGWNVDWQLGGQYLLIAESGRLKPDNIGGAQYQLEKFLEHVPDYVWEDYGGR